MPNEAAIDAVEADRRIIEPHEFVADTMAFVDVRLPRSAGKASYSIVGPGVSQNADQSVNLSEPHGFCVGAASMPNGVVNNPHLHYTAEVFVCTRGAWRMAIGQGGEQTLDIGAGDVFSVPTWIFRGFENIGVDDGWLFTLLGGDDPGGVLWAPEVLRGAAETGLYLTPDSSVIDHPTGRPDQAVVGPVEQAQLTGVDSYTDDELQARVVRAEGLNWSEVALLASVLPGHESSIAPVIGYGITEYRRHESPLRTSHGFTAEWLRLPPGSSMGRHRHDHHQVTLLTQGDWKITYNCGGDKAVRRPATGSVVSVPPGVWRDLENVGSDNALALVVCESDNRTRLEWSAEIVDAAHAAGWARDASGYVAPVALLAGGLR